MYIYLPSGQAFKMSQKEEVVTSESGEMKTRSFFLKGGLNDKKSLVTKEINR